MKRSRYPEGICFRCPRKGCQKVTSLCTGAFFENSNLQLETIIRMLHLWSTMTPLKKVREELQISEPTGVDWFNFIRDVCAEYFKQNPVEIGGPGIHVEIDESKFGRRKYNRRRWQEGHWVFGGIESITGKSFLVEVQQRDANTLLPIIMQYIR